MGQWKETLIEPQKSIREAIKIIDEAALQICLVVDKQGKLLGTVTDGDVRRALLKNLLLDEDVTQIMTRKTTVANRNLSKQKLLAMMKKAKVHQIPLVDDDGRVVGIETLDGLLQPSMRPNWVVLMAGGTGARLRPLTETCPKPMLRVGQKPLLETTLEALIESGFCNFFLSVNYKAEMIKGHFGDGAQWGVPIRYIQETKKMGTAGALSLLPERPVEPILVINGDILTKVNYHQLLDFHSQQGAKATMCVYPYEFKVPFGVVKTTDEHDFHDIEEKPMHRSLINAGIYVLDPESLDLIPKNSVADMPSLFKRVARAGLKTAVFPIREYWLDIGHHEDLERANSDIRELHKKSAS